MFRAPHSIGDQQVYSADEIARAAHVPAEQVADLLRAGAVIAFQDFVRETDAVHLVRVLSGSARLTADARAPVTLPRERSRRTGLPLAVSGLLHAALLASLAFIGWMGLLRTHDTEQLVIDSQPVRLVYLMTPGPGGGGGGGGQHVPIPPPRVERKAPVRMPRRVVHAVPPVRRPQPPPPIVPPPPPRVEPPKPLPQVIQAPVVPPPPADPVEKPGVVDRPASPATTTGPGAGGGAGTGAGTGAGPGEGSGLGPGSGGGTGGGPFQPGSGIDPPSLLREVKPLYTEEARRQSVEGDVLLEIVVRRDGSVGDVHVLHTLGAGLEQRAIDAVRQWRFGPARRQGTPVDVVVEVSVGFKLR